MLKAVCNNDLKFTHCYAGEVEAHHDASVLGRSEIWSFMREDGKFLNDTHLIGDKAYPCFPEIMTPYKDNGHLTNSQKQYHFLLSREIILNHASEEV
ncbi:hypothetical protein JTB14_024667 [Gonioctena quinquepunctata]|nr:hypothetical protein JTB14_024667 [Gonioctena quinquepunctata]